MPRLRFRYTYHYYFECTFCLKIFERNKFIFNSISSRPTLRLGGHREDKENRASAMIQEEEDEDGPILYRDDEDGEMEDEGKQLDQIAVALYQGLLYLQ